MKTSSIQNAVLVCVLTATTLWAADLPQAPQPQNQQQTAPDSVAAPLNAAAPLQVTNPLTTIDGVAVPHATDQPLRLTMDDAINLATEHNTSILISKQKERLVAGYKLTAFNALIPSLDFSAQTSTQEVNLAALGFKPSLVNALLPPGTPPISTIVKYDTTGAQVNLSQQLFNLPAYEIYKAANASIESTGLQALLNRADVIQNVAIQYLRILADQASIENAKAQVISDKETTRQAEEQHKAGVGTNLDYLRALAEQQQRERDVITAENNQAKDVIRLNRLMGLPADQAVELSDTVPYHEMELLSVDQAKQIAYGRRKDYLGLQADLRSATLQRRAVKFERLPVVKVNGFYGVLGETHGLYHGVFNVQGGINVPIFQEAQIRGDQAVADAQISKLRSQTGSLRIDIEEQIRSAQLDVQASAQLVQVAQSNVELAKQELLDTSDRYRTGVDDNLPVIQAEAAIADAQARLVASMFNFNQAKLQLARNTGVVETQYRAYLGQ